MKVGLKAGKYSLFHGGHCASLKVCSQLCDYLIVLTQTDRVIKQLTGKLPPMNLQERIFILESLCFVDEVRVYDALTEELWVSAFINHKLHRRFGADAKSIMFHSEELRDREDLPCKDIVDEVIFIPRQYQYRYTQYESTSDMMKEIANREKEIL